MGINTGLRVNDLARFKVGDIKNKPGFTIREGKTYKKRDINVGMLQNEIRHFTEDKNLSAYWFPSQKERNPLQQSRCIAFSRVQLFYLGVTT